MPTPQRLPIVNSDDGQWGDILNKYIKKEHYDDGTDNAVNGGHQTITIRAGTTSAGTAPITLASGSLMTTPETGAVEFEDPLLYYTPTISSTPTRYTIAAYDSNFGAEGDLYFRAANGTLTYLPIGPDGSVLTPNPAGHPDWIAPFLGAITTLTSNTTIYATHNVWLVDASGGNVTVTLCPAANTGVTNCFYIKRIDSSSNTITIARSNSDLIDGQTSIPLIGQYTVLSVVSDTVSNWYII